MTEGRKDFFPARPQAGGQAVFQAAELADHPSCTKQEGGHLVSVGKAMPESGERFLHGFQRFLCDEAVRGWPQFFYYRRHAFQDLDHPAVGQAGRHQGHDFPVLHLFPVVEKSQGVGVDIGPLMVLPVDLFQRVCQGAGRPGAFQVAHFFENMSMSASVSSWAKR